MTNIELAETHTLEEAQRRWNSAREFDLPLCADRVDALGVYHVDCQYIPCEDDTPSDCTAFVAFRKGKWDGNDVFWLQEAGLPTTDFSKAKIFDSPTQDDNLVWLPFEKADAVKRLTFDVRLIDRRRMIQSAGLLTPDHIKRDRRRKQSTGKVRWNCPGCGKLHWQLNPYDFDGCRDIECEEFRSNTYL